MEIPKRNARAKAVIRVTRIDGKPIVLNADWIQSVEETPDTLITLTTGFKLMVKDSVEDVMKAFKRYKRETSTISIAGDKS